MRYFKYDGPWDDLEAMKRQYGDLSDQARQQRRKAERMRKLGKVEVPPDAFMAVLKLDE